MDKQLTSLEVIGMAVRSEEDAVQFYTHISQMIENEVVRAKYQHLAKEEAMHRKLLVDLYKKMAAEQKKPPKIPGNPVTAEGGAVPADIEDSLEALLTLAIQREHDACAFYRRAAESSADMSGRRILDYLVHVEAGHAEMLENEKEAYLENRKWYTGEDDPGLIHLGP